MAIFRQGVSTKFGNSFIPNIENQSFNNNESVFFNETSNSILPVRVTSIVLDKSHPKYQQVGGENGIGAICFQSMLGDDDDVIAYPFNKQNVIYPLTNEIVLIISIDSKLNEEENGYSPTFYYFNPIGIWNHPHHNAHPPLEDNKNLDLNDYSSTELGYIRRLDDDEDIELNDIKYPSEKRTTFKEKNNIHPIKPFKGDYILEGRFGNSLRFGSTNISKNYWKGIFNSPLPGDDLNSWSTQGNPGDPITILRNGQPVNSTDEGWINIKEELNKDLSSIYLTSYQTLPNFTIANENYQSYLSSKPFKPATYSNPQIILNSSRIVINSQQDSTLISGEQSVLLSSNNSINLESKDKICLYGENVVLGGNENIEPLLKGDTTVKLLTGLVEQIKLLSVRLQTLKIPSNPKDQVNDGYIQEGAENLEDMCNRFLQDINSVKSITVKTK
jgi:hypothetical protein